jgi:DNA-binding response OmpR family regulator
MKPAVVAFDQRISGVRSRGPLVLVVEDTLDQRDLFVEEFESAGFAVLEAPDGETAIDAAVHSSPEAIVLDLMLPRVSGFNVARVLRAHDRTRRAAIVAVTALTSETFRAEALDAGCDSVLRKPLIGATVVAEIMRLLAKRRNPQESTPPKL